MRYRRFVTSALWLVVGVLLSTGLTATTIESLGSLDFPNSGAPEAQDAILNRIKTQTNPASEILMEAVDPSRENVDMHPFAGRVVVVLTVQRQILLIDPVQVPGRRSLASFNSFPRPSHGLGPGHYPVRFNQLHPSILLQLSQS